MKNALLLLPITILLLSQCSQDKSLNPQIDKDKATKELMNALAPQLTGTWSMKQLQIKYQNSSFQNEINVKRDTTLTNFATLDLALYPVQANPNRSRYVGTIQRNKKTYPIRFDLLAGTWIFSQQGPKAYFLIEYNYPPGPPRPTEREEYYLQQIGLLLETFALEITDGQPTMIWRGLNRGIDQIELIKK